MNDKPYKPFTEDEFWNHYKPQINHIMRAKYPNTPEDSVSSYGGTMYETFGEEVEYIRSLCKEGKGNLVWTIVDCDGELVIQSGYWFVNRIGYIVTEKPWEEEGVHVEEDWS